MSTARPELTVPAEPVRSRPGRVADFARRHAGAGGLLLWAAAAAVFALHSIGLALPDPTRFAMLDCWLLGLGCLGCPALPLRLLGCWFRPEACRLIAVFGFTIALVLTGLTLGGALHLNMLDGLFGMILAESVGIQAANAADAEVVARRREAVGYQNGREDTMAGQMEVRYTALANLDRLEQMTAAQRAALVDIISQIDEDERCARPLHLVTSLPVNGMRPHGA